MLCNTVMMGFKMKINEICVCVHLWNTGVLYAVDVSLFIVYVDVRWLQTVSIMLQQTLVMVSQDY